jgi:hypothetical protein
MIVALDATPVTVSTGGVRRYTEELALALARNFPDDQYGLLSDQPFAGPGNTPPEPALRNFRRTPLVAVGLPRALSRLRIDLFHGTDFAVPYLPLRPSVTEGLLGSTPTWESCFRSDVSGFMQDLR